MDESSRSRCINDIYFSRMHELSKNAQLVPRLRFMIGGVLELRVNKWVPHREEVSNCLICNHCERLFFLYGIDFVSLKELNFYDSTLSINQQISGEFVYYLSSHL